MATSIRKLPWKANVKNIAKCIGTRSIPIRNISGIQQRCHLLSCSKDRSYSHCELRCTRNLSVSPVQLMAKKIDVTEAENKTVVEGIKCDSGNALNLRENKAPTRCPLCEFQDSLTYRDVLILHQFLSPDGRILPRHVTGMCRTMQWKLQNILYQSYSAGLLPDYKPDLPIAENPKTYSKDYKWRKNNVYYEDFSLENPL